MSVVPCHSLLRHASVAGDVALVDNLAGQHLRHKAIGENQNNNTIPAYIPIFFIKVLSIIFEYVSKLLFLGYQIQQLRQLHRQVAAGES